MEVAHGERDADRIHEDHDDRVCSPPFVNGRIAIQVELRSEVALVAVLAAVKRGAVKSPEEDRGHRIDEEHEDASKKVASLNTE